MNIPSTINIPADVISAKAEALLAEARWLGLVLTIEHRRDPLKPIGEFVVDVRERRIPSAGPHNFYPEGSK